MTTNLSDLPYLLEHLKEQLTPIFTPPRGQGGHDIGHVMRMEAMYPEIAELIPGVNEHEYKVAVWAHNIDRVPEFEKAIKTSADSFGDYKIGLAEYLRFWIPSTLNWTVREDIIHAILEHSKRDDGPNDSLLLQALRLADKWDRIGALGIAAGFACHGHQKPAYHLESPFGYGSTAEGQGGCETIYQNLYRIMEWYAQFPLIRELVRRHPWRFENFLFSVRAFGREVAEAHGVPNRVEDDIRKCLGRYYDNWQPRSLT